MLSLQLDSKNGKDASCLRNARRRASELTEKELEEVSAKKLDWKFSYLSLHFLCLFLLSAIDDALCAIFQTQKYKVKWFRT